MARSLSLLLTIAQVQAQVQSGSFAKGTLNIIYLSKVAYSGTGEKRKKFYHLAKDKYSDCSDPSKYDGTIHDFSSKNIENTTKVDFSHGSYKGKVLLVVNTASFWGHTPQYYTLNALTEKYADRPFKILGFPCNQFLRQVRARLDMPQ